MLTIIRYPKNPLFIIILNNVFSILIVSILIKYFYSIKVFNFKTNTFINTNTSVYSYAISEATILAK